VDFEGWLGQQHSETQIVTRVANSRGRSSAVPFESHQHSLKRNTFLAKLPRIVTFSPMVANCENTKTIK